VAARVCDSCSIRYPQVLTECRVCGNVLRFAAQGTVSDWERESSEGIVARSLDDEHARPTPLIRIGAIRDAEMRLWLHDVDLLSAGWRGPLGDFQWVELIDGKIVEVQGYDAKRGRYWVEVVIGA
jgi:hypothetical protein